MSKQRTCGAAGLWLALGLALGCGSPQPPPTRELIHLHGSPYARGLEHGQKLRSKVRAFYTTLLTTSLLPYLNREQPGIEAFLIAYRGDAYANGPSPLFFIS